LRRESRTKKGWRGVRKGTALGDCEVVRDGAGRGGRRGEGKCWVIQRTESKRSPVIKNLVSISNRKSLRMQGRLTSLPSSNVTVSFVLPVTSPASAPSSISSGISTSTPGSFFPGTPAISHPSPSFGSHTCSEIGCIGTFALIKTPFEAESIEIGNMRGSS